MIKSNVIYTHSHVGQVKNRTTLITEGGLSLVQVNHLDESGKIIGVSYEVYDEDGDVLDEFTSLEGVIPPKNRSSYK